VLGPQADQVAVEIRAAMGARRRCRPRRYRKSAPAFARTIDPAAVPPALAQALGGAAALAASQTVHGRLLLPAGTVVDETALVALGARGVVATAAGPHVLFAEDLLGAWCLSR
jgi:PTS system N-acetylglucosamine-specific IIC component